MKTSLLLKFGVLSIIKVLAIVSYYQPNGIIKANGTTNNVSEKHARILQPLIVQIGVSRIFKVGYKNFFIDYPADLLIKAQIDPGYCHEF